VNGTKQRILQNKTTRTIWCGLFYFSHLLTKIYKKYKIKEDENSQIFAKLFLCGHSRFDLGRCADIESQCANQMGLAGSDLYLFSNPACSKTE
jgi:hypothetical protein